MSGAARRTTIIGGRCDADRRTSLKFCGSESIFHTVSRTFYRVSPSAGFIPRSLTEGITPNRLADIIKQRYHVDRAAPLRDVELLHNDVAAFEPLSGSRT